MRTREEEIRVQQEVGLLTERDAGQAVVELHRATAAELEGIIAQWQTLAEVIGDPEILAKLDDVRVKHMELKNAISYDAKQIQDSLESNFVDAFTAFIEGTQSAKDAFRQFAASVLRDIARIAAQKFAQELFSGFGGILSGIFHTGGIVGDGGQLRAVNPLVFANAPRYHTGGMAGLKPNEVPAILQRGEEVLTASDPRHQNNGGASSQNVRIINAFDMNVVGDYFNTSSGEKVILNVIKNNPGAISKVLS
jgi:hypothetical protein